MGSKFAAYQISTIRVSEYRDIVNHPGKFESESAYVPYYWDMQSIDYDTDATAEFWDSYGVDYYDSDDIYDLPNIYRFDVTLLDRYLFPELEGITAVYLYLNNNGFVNTYEIRTHDGLIATDSPFVGL